MELKNEIEAKEKFVPSEELSRLYVKTISARKEEEPSNFLALIGEVTGRQISWDELIQEETKNFTERVSEKMHDIFIFFARRFQENGKKNKETCSTENGFTEECLWEILYHFGLSDDEEDESLSRKFVNRLYQEFVFFLASNKFESEIVRVYLENGRIIVESLEEYKPLDINEILKSDKWTTF